MATEYNNPILSSFLILLLAHTITTMVIAQDDHDHDHDTVPPPPPPMVEDDHDHDHDTVPPPPPPMVEDDHDHDHDTVPPPPPPMVEDDHDHDHDTVPLPPSPPPAHDDHDDDHSPTPPPPPPAAPVTIVNIFDTDAKPVVAGQKYYILPVVQRRGGGVGTRPKNSYEQCPLSVAQETDTAALGIPVTFKPIKSGVINITFSLDMNIAFTSTNGCKQAPIWTLKPGNEYNETQFVILGGSTGTRGPNSVKSWFKIERFFPRFHFDYKFVYFPSTEDYPGFKETICGDLGVYVQEDGSWLIGVGAPPLRVKFKKA